MTGAATNIAARTLLIAGVFALVAVLYSASETRAIGHTFAQENVNLTIDSEASYNGTSVPSATWELKDLTPGVDKFFNFDDIKPGDSGENTISLHVDRDAWVCLAFGNLVEAENGINEPEGLVDASADGELAEGMEFFSWTESDGDNVFEPQNLEEPLFGPANATTLFDNLVYAIADALNPPPLGEGETRYFGIAWCAGNLDVDLGTGAMTCDPTTLGNEAQTDSFSVDVTIGATGASENPNFTCSGEEPPGEEETPGLGEEIGLYVKCELIAGFGWPLPTYESECPGGFGQNEQQEQPEQQVQETNTREERNRTRTR